MIHRLEFRFENTLDGLDVLEGDGAIVEIALRNLGVYNLVNQLVDAFLGIFFQASGSRFYGISHHQDSLLSGKWIRARIAEERSIGFLAWMVVLPADVEILGLSRTVMGRDEVLDNGR